MPVVDAHLMMAKGNPLMPRLNKAIKKSRIDLNRIMIKYETLARSYDRCPNREAFKPMREFQKT